MRTVQSALEQSIVFVCGPDKTGKTNVSAALASALGVSYFKASSEHATFVSSRSAFLEQLRYADFRALDLIEQCRVSLVFDRGYPCEWVYSRVTFRETDEALLRKEDAAYARLGAVIVLCLRRSYAGLQDDLDESIREGELQKIGEEYERFASEFTACPVVKLYVDDEDTSAQVERLLPLLARAGVPAARRALS